MGLFLGVVAAIFLGGSDFLAARVGRRESFFSVCRTNMAVSSLLGPILLLIKPWRWGWADVGIGALSGVAMSIGLLLLYRGYSISRIGVVAPVSSVMLAAVPVAYAMSTGDRPGVAATIGITLGLCALVLTTWQPGGVGSTVQGLLLGLISGVLFGLAFICMDAASDAAGLLPVLVQRVVGFALLSSMQPFERSRLVIVAGSHRYIAWATGVFAMTALASLQVGYELGSAGPVSVAVSQFATAAVVLSVLFNHERMRWWQACGVGASAVGVALLALG